MASASDIKVYKSASGGLGGAIDTSAPVVSGDRNNLFPLVTRAQSVSGVTQYLCFYFKNESAETVKKFSFRLVGSDNGTVQWARGTSGRNGTEQTIANITTPPVGVSWREEGSYSVIAQIFNPNDIWPIWVQWSVPEGTPAQTYDSAFFRFLFTIEATGTPAPPDSSGGGTGSGGGNPLPTPTDWKIAVAGDWGVESMTDKVMAMCQGYNYVINVGDNGYGDNSWTKLWDKYKLKSKSISAFGNHEYDDGVSFYKNYYGYSTTYNYRTFQNVAIISLDSNINADVGSTQYNKIVEYLKKAQNDSAIDWIFCTNHHPWFGASSKHAYDEDNMVENYHSLFMSYGVAFVLTGHNHNWQLSKKVSEHGTSPTVVDSSSPFTNDTTGLIHVVSGTGGHDSGGSLYSLGSQPSFQLYQNNDNNGIFEILASNNGQTLTCSFRNISNQIVGPTIVYNK